MAWILGLIALSIAIFIYCIWWEKINKKKHGKPISKSDLLAGFLGAFSWLFLILANTSLIY
jgi:hypothetical protein